VFNRFMTWLVDGIRLRLVGPTLLEDVPHLPLNATLADAIALYGEPSASEVNDEFPESREYIFPVSDYHEIVAWEWRSKIHAVLYQSARGHPELDLATIFKAYGNGQDWTTVDEGYLYRRSDQSVRVWCSAIPAIGVGTEEFFKAKDSPNHASS